MKEIACVMSENPRILIMVCTYNERENLEQLIPELCRLAPTADILIIDDNSPDGTGQYVDQLIPENPKLHVIHRPGKLGLGTATTAGFRFAIENNYDFVINLDADFSHPPRYIPALLKKSNDADVVIASRYVRGGSMGGLGAARQLMSRALNLYARTVLGLSTLDNSGSFRCYRVSRLAQVDWSKARATGYAIEEEILFHLKCAGATFTEVPFSYEERRHGHTKLHWKEAVAASWVLLKLRFTGSN